MQKKNGFSVASSDFLKIDFENSYFVVDEGLTTHNFENFSYICGLEDFILADHSHRIDFSHK